MTEPADVSPIVAATEGEALGSLRATFKGIGAVVAPTTLITALLYYFGWVRTDVQAELLGFDESMLGYSVQDYLLRSMSSMFGPLLVGLLAALVGLALHGLVARWAAPTGAGADGNRRARARRDVDRLAGALAAVGLASLVVGVLGTQVDDPSDEVYVGAPAAVTLGVLLLLYAAHLHRAFAAPGGPRPAEPFEGFGVARTAVIVMLVLLSLFWNVSHYATYKGRQLAATVSAMVPSLPSVVVYSRTPLHLPPPVTVETLSNDPAGGYIYAYQGLKLLFQAGGKYFLRPSDTTVPLNILLAVSPDIRVELYRV